MQDQDPKAWGPAAWTFLHWAAARADRTHEQARVYAFLRTLTQFLPCKKCRRHLKKNLPQIRLDPTNASRTLYQLHNLVNHQNGKDDFTCFTRVRKHYAALAKEDPPLKIWPFLYAVATSADANAVSSDRFWRQVAPLLPETWAFAIPPSESPGELMTHRLYRYHKGRDPAALPLKHYILACKSGC